MYFYLKDTGMVFGVQLLEEHRKKGHLILVVKTEQTSTLTLLTVSNSVRISTH